MEGNLILLKLEGLDGSNKSYEDQRGFKISSKGRKMSVDIEN